ncbi:hypothetical protein CWE12_06365 [Aliidiomarina sedimenti]|uniref:Beta-lactamase-related domain-containing protein n=1 Tax=Aliidiomarina sedimenti TaxID=1933879 RepID=A0ABY0C0K0_9GAMM|nr:serine hydrolase [Aliidiomarina sedimenti]RUO30857.1 hypothetical protein CWE12_06365 [Aliidiomarina sedimenti]
MRRFSLWLTVLLTLVSVSAVADTDETTNAALAAALQERAERLSIGQAEVIIFDGQGARWRHSVGQSDENRLYFVGQVTETLTALAVMRLVEQGQWSLFDRIDQRLPELAVENPYQEQAPVLIIHLLEHSSGFDQRRFKSHLQSGTEQPPLMQRLAQEQAALKVRWAPGSASSPSTLNYAVLAAMLERHYDLSWWEVIETEVLQPLGIESAQPGSGAGDVRPGSHGLPAEEVPFVARYFAEADGLWLRSDDLVTLGRFFLSRGASSASAVLRADSIIAMESPRSTAAADAGLEYGYAVGLDTRARFGLWRGRQSSLAGYSTQFRYNPELDLGYVIATDHQSFLPALDELVWQHLLVEQQGVVNVPGGVSVEQRWQGWYRLENPEHAILAPLHSIFDLAYVSRDGANLTLKPWVSATVPLRSVDGSRLAHRGDGSEVGVLFSDEYGTQRIQIHTEVRQRTPVVNALAPPLLVILGLLVLLSHPFARRNSLRYPTSRHLTTAAAWCLLLAAFVAGSLSLEQASTDNWRSVLLFIFTFLFPLFALAGLLSSLFYWRREPDLRAKWRNLLGAVIAVAFAVWFITSGWFALRTWAW